MDVLHIFTIVLTILFLVCFANLINVIGDQGRQAEIDRNNAVTYFLHTVKFVDDTAKADEFDKNQLKSRFASAGQSVRGWVLTSWSLTILFGLCLFICFIKLQAQ